MGATDSFKWDRLSIIDSLMPRLYIRQMHCFPSTDPLISEILKDGLRETITSIPFLAASVIKCSSQKGALKMGGPFSTIDEIFSCHEHLEGMNYSALKEASFPLEPLNASFLSPLLPAPPVPEPAPVMRVRMTRVERGFILYICIHHCVVDVNGLAALLKVWAAHCRNTSDKEVLVDPDCLDRTALLGSSKVSSSVRPAEIWYRPRYRPTGKEISLLFTSLNRTLRSCLIKCLVPLAPVPSTPDSETALYYFPAKTLKELKVEVLKHAVAAGVEWLSTNDILSALVWSAAMQARGTSWQPNIQSRSTVGMSVDIRGRLEPPLPNSYIGNAIGICWVTISRKSLLSAADPASPQALAKVATSIRKSLSGVDNARMRNLVAYVEGQQDLTKLSWGSPTTDFMVTTWAGQDSYGLDWGEVIGKCEAIRARKLAITDYCVILPRHPSQGCDEASSGGLEVMISLRSDRMRRLQAGKLMNAFAQLRCSV